MPQHRELQWRTSYLRPVAVAEVHCPIARDIMKHENRPDWLSVAFCEVCSHAHAIHIYPKKRTGEVLCDA